MQKILFIIGVLLIIAWIIGFMVFHLNGLIHILPLAGIFALIARIFYNTSVVR